MDEKRRWMTSVWFSKTPPDGRKQNRSWIAYSPKIEAAYCIPCILFSKTPANSVSLFEMKQDSGSGKTAVLSSHTSKHRGIHRLLPNGKKWRCACVKEIQSRKSWFKKQRTNEAMAATFWLRYWLVSNLWQRGIWRFKDRVTEWR